MNDEGTPKPPEQAVTDSQEPNKASALALTITTDELVKHLNSKAPGRLCFYCGKEEYSVPANPKGTHAALISAPVPNSAPLGAWFFMLICNNCGHSTLMNAHQTTFLIRGEG